MKLATLSEEITRRLRNTSLAVEGSKRLEIIEKACIKMKTIGHNEGFIRDAVVNGVRAFKDRVERSMLGEDHPGY